MKNFIDLFFFFLHKKKDVDFIMTCIFIEFCLVN